MGYCVVCGKDLEAGAARIGDRLFCDTHYSRALGSRKSALWGSLAGVLIACLAAFSGTLLGLIGAGSAPALLRGGLAVLIAAAPAALWVFVFYRMDSIEPEPPAMVAGVLVLGALVAGAIGIPFLEGALRRVGLPRLGAAGEILESVLFIGLGQEFLKFLGLRLTIYRKEEFDERIDGIVYGAAIGLGYALMSNLRLAFSPGGMDLDILGFESAIACLAQASSGGLCGYFLARAKFGGRQAPMMLLGILSAAILNGIEGWLLRGAAYQSLAYLPWKPLIWAGGIALACFAFLFLLTWTENGRAIARASKGVRP